MKISLETLNQCDEATFISICGPIFENSHWIFERIAHQRPFAGIDRLLEAAHFAVIEEEMEEVLIDAHPDLAGRLAEEGKLTAESTREQQAAGLHDLTPQQRQQFKQYNEKYRAKFGFPFIICARKNKAQAILEAFPERLKNDREEEVIEAIGQIMEIAKLRLEDLVGQVVNVENMPHRQAKLVSQAYGKSKVRLTKVTRLADRHELRELSIDVALQGEFEDSYLTGDNASIIATDTIKNTIYALAADDPVDSPESFSLAITNHFFRRHSHVSAVTVKAEETPWERIPMAGGPHRHSFVGSSSERRTCRVKQVRDEDDVIGLVIQAGLTGLGLLKTTDSAFKGFLRDEFTTLADADDRIFATLLDATWTYEPAVAKAPAEQFDFNATFLRLRASLIATFADHFSLSVQQTMFEMGKQALAVCPEMTAIELTMPNQHRIPVNLESLGKQNRSEVFITTSEPFGFISANIAREGI